MMVTTWYLVDISAEKYLQAFPMRFSRHIFIGILLVSGNWEVLFLSEELLPSENQGWLRLMAQGKASPPFQGQTYILPQVPKMQ